MNQKGLSNEMKKEAGRTSKINRLRLKLLKKKAEIEEVIALEEMLKKKNLISMFEPYEYQQKALDMFHSGKNVVVMPCSNKVGKTAFLACLGLSWCLGYEPWNEIPESDFSVRVGDKFYMPSSLGIMPPVRLRVTGEDWEKHVALTLLPEFKKWAHDETYTTKKNNMSIEALWEFKNGSSFDVMTYRQPLEQFEGWLGHGWLADEPPPQEIWSAMSRGLFTLGGKVFLSMTPLSEAWVLDELVLSNRPDVGTILDICIWDNPELYKHDKNVLVKVGFSEDGAVEWLEKQKELAKTTKRLDTIDNIIKEVAGRKTVLVKNDFGKLMDMDAYDYALKSLKIHRFIKDLPSDEERLPRLFGKFKSLVGLVLKGFRDDIHILEPFKVPPDLPVVAMIDIHLNKPQAIGFYCFDKMDRIIAVDEVWENLSPDQIADEIIRKKKLNSWRLKKAFIDALSKGDEKFMRNRAMVEDSFTIIQKKLAKFGITLEVASKDKDSGIRNIDARLTGANNIPSFFICSNCERHLHEIKRWVYDKDGKPKKELDDMMENTYRATLTGVKYTPPELFTGELKYAKGGLT